MQKQFKKYFSFFFLFLFLFPLVEKEVHAFEHQNDLHCSAVDKHFHQLEHSCSICDYTATDSATAAENNFSFVISEFSYTYNSFNESVNIPKALPHLPSRAPPIV